VTSIALPGIPIAALVAISVILSAIGVPTESIGVLIVFDRILDMARTGVNVLGDAVSAAVVARMEGEETALGPVPSRWSAG
jgi:proton glutamate symport protein